jgi:hypothetical protein
LTWVMGDGCMVLVLFWLCCGRLRNGAIDDLYKSSAELKIS